MDTTFWIIIIYFAVSALGGLLSQQRKKAAEQRQQPRQTPPPKPRDRAAESRPLNEPDPVEERRLTAGRAEPRQRPTPRQTPEEIAAEIRRVMGLEREEAKVEVIEEVYEPAYSSGPTEYVFDPDLEPEQIRDHGGHLQERIHARQDRGSRSPGSLESRHLTSEIGSKKVGTLAGRYDDRTVPRMVRPVRDSGVTGYIDIANLARALVTAEVLGPPKALRDDW